MPQRISNQSGAANLPRHDMFLTSFRPYCCSISALRGCPSVLLGSEGGFSPCARHWYALRNLLTQAVTHPGRPLRSEGRFRRHCRHADIPTSAVLQAHAALRRTGQARARGVAPASTVPYDFDNGHDAMKEQENKLFA